MDRPVLIFDNGAHTIKAAWAHEESYRKISNGIYRSQRDKRTYIADQLDTDCTDFGGLNDKLAFDRGILTHWDVEKVVWDRVFGKDVLNVDPSQTSLLLTEPCFNLPNVGEYYDQMLFEEYEFAAYARCPTSTLVPYGKLEDSEEIPDCSLVVDAGFSHTCIVPIVLGHVMWGGVRRIDIGGKVMTNYLKELVSFRQWFMMDQTHVINAAKERLGFLSVNFKRDVEECRTDPKNNSISRAYVLPDFALNSTNYLGYPRPLSSPVNDKLPEHEDQVLFLNNERFSVPEMLFQPSVIDLAQGGLPEAILQSITSLPLNLQGLLWQNIICVGGTSKYENFQERLYRDLRALAPNGNSLKVIVPEDPIGYAVESAKYMLNSSYSTEFYDHIVTRAEYLEHGSNICRKKFQGPPLPPNWAPKSVLQDESAEIEGLSTHSTSDDDGPKSKGKKKKNKATKKSKSRKLGLDSVR